MKKYISFTLLFTATGISHILAEDVLAGWFAWGGAADTDYVQNVSADELATGFTGAMGAELITAFSTLGGGHSVTTWGSASSTDYGGFASANITGNSLRILARETNSFKMLDFQITNNSGSSYALDSIYFNHLWTAGADAVGFTVKHLSAISDLLASGATNLGTIADPGVNGTWSNGVVDFSSLNYVLADGQSFGFRIEVDRDADNFSNISLDNVAITGAAVPEPSTYAISLGLLLLAVVALRRRK